MKKHTDDRSRSTRRTTYSRRCPATRARAAASPTRRGRARRGRRFGCSSGWA